MCKIILLEAVNVQLKIRLKISFPMPKKMWRYTNTDAVIMSLQH